MNFSLTFRDIAALRVIAEEGDERMGVTYTKLSDLENNWLRAHRIPARFATPYTGMSQIQTTINRLSNLGYIRRVGKRQGFRASDAGLAFLEELGNVWRKWPLILPVEDSDVVMGKAIRADKFRALL